MRRAIPSGTRTLKLTGSNGDEGGGVAVDSQPARNHNACSRTSAKRGPRSARDCCLVTPYSDKGPPPASSGRQVTIRRRSRGLPLRDAVRAAVDVYFRFRFRAAHDKALWSATERVWLGKQTFLSWALWLTDIDIPRAVSTAAGVPDDVEQLRSAVLAELAAYWSEQFVRLPRRRKPRWLPLP